MHPCQLPSVISWFCLLLITLSASLTQALMGSDKNPSFSFILMFLKFVCCKNECFTALQAFELLLLCLHRASFCPAAFKASSPALLSHAVPCGWHDTYLSYKTVCNFRFFWCASTAVLINAFQPYASAWFSL